MLGFFMTLVTNGGRTSNEGKLSELELPREQRLLSHPLHEARQPICMIVKFLNNAMDTKFGFSCFAETWNGRLAMMGFIIGLSTELLTGQGILSQIGIG